MKNIVQKVLMLLVLTFITQSSLKSQTDWTKKQWETINEGEWGFMDDPRQSIYYGVNNMSQEGTYIIIPTMMNDGKTPIKIDGKSQYSPLLIWDTKKDSFLSMTDNWVGDPMKPVTTFRFDSVTYYVTDRIKMYKVEIDFNSKKLTYTKVFQGFDDNSANRKLIWGFHKGKNYIYGYGDHFIHLFNLDGTFIKSLRNYEDGESTISTTTSVVEYNDTVYFGYTFSGGLSDGSGMATLDLSTGKITKQYNSVWSGSFHYEPELRFLNGHFYLHCDGGGFAFDQTLFEYKNGKWTALIRRCVPPELVKGQIIMGIMPTGLYVNGDTINKRGNPGSYYLLENNIAVKRLDPDPRLLIQFDGDYKTAYYGRHGYMPNVVYIFEINGIVYGIAPHVIAKLVDKPTSILKVSSTNVLKTYPNPAQDVIHISNLEKETAYTVTDMTGKTILTGNTMDTIDVSSLVPGMYALYIMNDGINSSAKFIKE